MNRFLRALSYVGKEAAKRGVKVDVLRFANIWSGRYKTQEERRVEQLWKAKEKRMEATTCQQAKTEQCCDCSTQQ